MSYLFKIAILLIPLGYFLFLFSKKKNSYLPVLANIYLILLLSITLFSIGKYVYQNYRQPPTWDFLVFWVNGNVGISGENFYNPDNYSEIALPYDPGQDFREEIIDVGFWYPPFTMFVFSPLGLFDISSAYLLWQISSFLICIINIYMLWNLFLKRYGILSLLLIAVLMLRLESTRSTFSLSQTNFLVLLFFLMFWQNRLKGWGGVWLALCVIIKPYMLLLYLYPLLLKKWRVLIVAMLTLMLATILSIIVFGSDVFISFLHNPTPDTPSFVYTEMINQSLLATILRLSSSQIMEASPVLNPLYLSISLLLTLITAWMAVQKNRNHDWVILSVLFLSIIIYPASLTHYSVFIIVPVALLLQESNYSLKQKMIVFLIIFVAYFLSGYNSGSYTFFANIFIWLVSIILVAKPNFEKAIISNNDALPDSVL